jgi:hypothetical protein
MHHSPALRARWKEFSLAVQMANIGSEVERAISWREKGNRVNEQAAFERALELIDFTLEDVKNRGRLKEIARVREAFIDYLVGENLYGSSKANWQSYFYHFAVLARNQRVGAE